MEHDSLWASNIQINEEHSHIDTIILFFSYSLHAAVDRGIWNVSVITAMLLQALAWELRTHAFT